MPRWCSRRSRKTKTGIAICRALILSLVVVSLALVGMPPAHQAQATALDANTSSGPSSGAQPSGVSGPRVVQLSTFYIDVSATANGTKVNLGRAIELHNVTIQEGQALPAGAATFSGPVAGTTFNATLTLAASAFDPLTLALQRFQISLASGQWADVSNILTQVITVPGTTNINWSTAANVSGIGWVIFTFTGQVQATALPNGAVVLCADSNFGGFCQSVSQDVADLATIQVGNDALSSIRVPAGQVVSVWDDGNYAGLCATLTGDANLGDTVVGNDRATSLRVGTPCPSNPPWLCQDSGYTNCEAVTGDQAHLGWTWVDNDRISSVRVPAGQVVALWQEENFAGRCQTFTSDYYDLNGSFIGNDSASSAWVGRPCPSGPTVQLCVDGGFGGLCETFTQDFADLRASEVGNDTASSLRVPAGQVVSLYSDLGFAGACQTLTQDRSDLSGTVIGNDNVSSIRIGTTCH